MTPTRALNEEQRTRWNGIDGEYWTSDQDRLDRTLAPVTGPLLAFDDLLYQTAPSCPQALLRTHRIDLAILTRGKNEIFRTPPNA